MIQDFIEKNLKNAKYEILEDGTFFASVPGLRGPWANAKTLEKCRKELGYVLEEWLLLGIKLGHNIPGFHFADFAVRDHKPKKRKNA